VRIAEERDERVLLGSDAQVFCLCWGYLAEDFLALFQDQRAAETHDARMAQISHSSHPL
jgi:hypothetical protein